MHLLVYWTLRHVAYRYHGVPLAAVSSGHLRRAKPGDVLWLVTLRAGLLLLVGRVPVAEVTSTPAVDAALEPTLRGAWTARAHPSDAAPLRLINLSAMGVPGQLRFVSRARRVALRMEDGRVRASSLSVPRVLTDTSAALLDDVWARDDFALGAALEEIDTMLPLDDATVAHEGAAQVRPRQVRRRSRRLVAQAKARVQEQLGGLRCEVCGDDFAELYGDIGAGYIEAHHLVPLGELDTDAANTFDALVLLCANCHRMIHATRPAMPPDALRQRVLRQREQRGYSYAPADDTSQESR